VFAVRTFPDDGGDLTSQPRGERKRWMQTDAASAAIKDSIARSPLLKMSQAVMRQHMNPCTHGRIIRLSPANNLTPTSSLKKLISNTGEKVIPVFESGWYPNRSVLKEKAQAMSHANLAALRAAITK
jgi:hypothetical protein